MMLYFSTLIYRLDVTTGMLCFSKHVYRLSILVQKHWVNETFHDKIKVNLHFIPIIS